MNAWQKLGRLVRYWREAEARKAESWAKLLPVLETLDAQNAERKLSPEHGPPVGAPGLPGGDTAKKRAVYGPPPPLSVSELVERDRKSANAKTETEADVPHTNISDETDETDSGTKPRRN